MTNFSAINYPRAEEAVADAMRYSLAHDEGVSLSAPWGRWYLAVQSALWQKAGSAPIVEDADHGWYSGWYSGTTENGRHWHIFLTGTD